MLSGEKQDTLHLVHKKEEGPVQDQTLEGAHCWDTKRSQSPLAEDKAQEGFEGVSDDLNVQLADNVLQGQARRACPSPVKACAILAQGMYPRGAELLDATLEDSAVDTFSRLSKDRGRKRIKGVVRDTSPASSTSSSSAVGVSLSVLDAEVGQAVLGTLRRTDSAASHDVLPSWLSHAESDLKDHLSQALAAKEAECQALHAQVAYLQSAGKTERHAKKEERLRRALRRYRKLPLKIKQLKQNLWRRTRQLAGFKQAYQALLDGSVDQRLTINQDVRVMDVQTEAQAMLAADALLPEIRATGMTNQLNLGVNAAENKDVCLLPYQGNRALSPQETMVLTLQKRLEQSESRCQYYEQVLARLVTSETHLADELNAISEEMQTLWIAKHASAQTLGGQVPQEKPRSVLARIFKSR